MDEDILEHEYASQYYDPQKAHEYYLRTRDLKGKRKASDLPKSKRETWTVAKSNIDAEKKAATKNLASTHKADLEQMRKSTQIKKQQIQTKINTLLYLLKVKQNETKNRATSERKNRLDAIQAKARLAAEKVQKEAEKKINALPPLGDNPSKAQVVERNRLLASINNDLKGKISLITKKASEDSRAVMKSTALPKQDSSQSRQLSAERSQQLASVSNELRNGLKSSQQKYETMRKGLASKYESVYQREFDAIKSNK